MGRTSYPARDDASAQAAGRLPVFAAGGVAFGLFLLLYLVTGAHVWALPTMFATDGAELVIAARSLGVDHPPGHPLWLIFGYLFSFLPLSEPDRPVVLVSTFFGALTLAMLTATTLLMRARWQVTLLALIALGLSPIFWLHSAIIEVYTVQLALVAGLTFTEVRALGGARRLTFPPIFLLLGLTASSNALLAVLLCPGVILTCWLVVRSRTERRMNVSEMSRSLGALLIGLTPLLYLPWRLSSPDAYINDLVFIPGFKVGSLKWYAWYLSGWEFTGHKVTGQSLTAYPGLIWQWLTSLGRHMSPLIPAMLLLVPWTALPRGRRQAATRGREQTTFDRAPIVWLLGLELLVTVAPVLGYQVADREVFYLPSFYFALLVTVPGFELLFHRLKVEKLLPSALFLLVGIWTAWEGSRFVLPITRNEEEYRLREKRFRALPLKATVMGYDDGVVARYRYFGVVKGFRPDITIETFARMAPRQSEVAETHEQLDQREMVVALHQFDRAAAFNKVRERCLECPMFLVLNDQLPAEFPGYRFRSSPIDSRLLEVQEAAPSVVRSDPIPVSVSAPVRFGPSVEVVGYTLQGLDGLGSSSLPVTTENGSDIVQATVVRDELFDLELVLRRLTPGETVYYAEIALLDESGVPLVGTGGSGFRASRQLEALSARTLEGQYQKSVFSFKVPLDVKVGPAVLGVVVFETTRQVLAEYKGKAVRQLEPLSPERASAVNQDYASLGTVLIR